MQGQRIVSIGECMVEMAPAADGLYAMGFAGDTFNTAWYLRQLLPHVPVDYLTAIGTDALSDRLFGFMAAEGIGTGHILRRADRTLGLYLIRVENGERSFSYWRSTSAARTLADAATPLDHALEGAGLAYLSGITLAILDPAARDRLLTALAQARDNGTRIAFDPNIRPALWSDPDAMRAALMRAAAGADVVLPSFEDEARWFGDADPQATARRYQAAGTALVVVKNGPGAVVTAKGPALTNHPLPGPVARPVDTTAAGDSFNAGFLAAHLTCLPLAQAVRNGATLAARVIAAPGALVRNAAEPPVR